MESSEPIWNHAHGSNPILVRTLNVGGQNYFCTECLRQHRSLRNAVVGYWAHPGIYPERSLRLRCAGAVCNDYGLRPVRAVERAVLNRFGEMARLKIFRRVQIGDGTRDFQDAVVGARGKTEA